MFILYFRCSSQCWKRFWWCWHFGKLQQTAIYFFAHGVLPVGNYTPENANFSRAAAANRLDFIFFANAPFICVSFLRTGFLLTKRQNCFSRKQVIWSCDTFWRPVIFSRLKMKLVCRSAQSLNPFLKNIEWPLTFAQKWIHFDGFRPFFGPGKILCLPSSVSLGTSSEGL